MIDLRKNETGLKHNIDRARERNIILPTLEQQRDPSKIPEKIKGKLTKVGMQDINPLNLFRITWKNEQKDFGGLFHGPNYIVLPPELTGVKCRIICMLGSMFIPSAKDLLLNISFGGFIGAAGVLLALSAIRKKQQEKNNQDEE